MHRFFTASPIPASGSLRLADELGRRISRVLRMREGDVVAVFDGSGREAIATISRIHRDAVDVTLLRTLAPAPIGPEIRLHAALIRANRFEWLVEKATELGVTSLQPVITEHCQVRATEIGGNRAARWQRIAIEAAEQCGRRTVPDVANPIALTEACRGLTGVLIVPWEGERHALTPLGEVLRLQTPVLAQPVPLTLMIGPEGGFSLAEVELMQSHGAILVSLGPLILRAETAAIVALGIAIDALWSTAVT